MSTGGKKAGSEEDEVKENGLLGYSAVSLFCQ